MTELTALAQTYPQTLPAMPQAPTSWHDPSMLGYVVSLGIVVLFVWSFLQERRISRQAKRQNVADVRIANAQDNAFVAALATAPEKAVPPAVAVIPEVKK